MTVIGRWWNERVLPLAIARAMRASQLEPFRREVAGAASGRVLELGIGAGANLGFYRRDLESLCGIDPSMPLLERAHAQTAWLAFPVQLLQERAERLPLPDATFDTVVSTWTLCSVDDPLAALREVRRVLKPGGRFLFIEHGLSGHPRAARVQRALTPCWCRLVGGCRLDRNLPPLIGQAGLRPIETHAGDLVAAPSFIAWHVRGVAAA